ncbi:MAG: glycosyltransferase [Chloroflexaceae bacterium]|jgi:glycosyltransferase involved in cell wall biosynthesis|nr:glycosyltransferase [Chloroflexaceae bacterium]
MPIVNRQSSIVNRQSPIISILMPTYGQAAFIGRALASAQAQTLADWELIIVDDGSPDDTAAVVEPFLADGRIVYTRLAENGGMGAALNHALGQARAEFIAYLPSDDVYYPEHLQSLLSCLHENPDAVLAFSGMRHHYNRSTEGQLPGEPLQLVQVLHRRCPERWLERAELVTDDLERMYWARLRPYGQFVGTSAVTCEWVDHPAQRHKLLREPLGGINPYRVHFKIKAPLRFHTTVGNFIDEETHYRRFRERPPTPPAAAGLKILLVGELAYNAERVLALEERGHQLYGLWMPDPYWYNTVGPLPFGHVQDLPRQNWQAAVRQLQPDLIYALLNWQAVPFAHHVLRENPGVPFVWHFKEGPFISLEKGHWREMLELYQRADGQIYSSPAMRDWYETLDPGLTGRAPTLVLDGDLPKRDWFVGERSPRLSERDGEIHTVVPGRPIGLHPHTVAELAAAGVHLHFYGDFTHGQWKAWIEKARSLAPRHLHLHANVGQDRWLAEFSQYDAGWLHYFASANGGDLRRANWDDLNYPARIATLAVAGLPMLQRDNSGALVASQNLARDMNLGLFFSSMAELAEQLRDETHMARLRDNVWRQREQFTFDAHAERLVAFFRQVIAHKAG